MNASSVRPQTKLAAAFVAAGVVSAASFAGMPDDRSLPVLNIDVAKTSMITDALFGLGDAVNGVASGLVWVGDASASMPFDVSSVLAVAVQNPSIGPNLLSWLLQRYVNPSINYPWFAYPYEIKASSIEPLAELLLPAALSGGIVNGIEGISDAINDALSGLPNADPGEFAMEAFAGTDIGRMVLAANLAATAPVWMLYNTAYYLGYLPANLEETLESAIRDPSEIPGLVSNLVYGLLSPTPNVGLLGDLLGNLTDPLTTLPGPIGELATNVVTAVANNINNLLSLLPPPITPTPFPSALRTPEVADVQVDANSELDPSLADGAITLLSADPVEKKVEAPDSTENTPPVTPQGPAPAAGDIDTGATPAADPDVKPDVKPDKPVTNTMTSGNKVSPGDKFDNQAKGETAKDETVKDETVKDTDTGDGATVATPGSADTTDPTGPQADPTDGADQSDPSEGSGAAA
jgi:hypothetical protein